jgi:hypothetical protein
MNAVAPLDLSVSDRDLVRTLRAGVLAADVDVMPESLAWHLFLELRRRGEPRAAELFLGTLQNLHGRRSLGAANLPLVEATPEEHRLVEAEEPFLADLWKAYKRCLQTHRPGPAAELLRDIREQLGC